MDENSPRVLTAYGLQLCIDGYGAPRERLEDVALLYRTLMELPEKIGMRRIGYPHIIEIRETPITGLSGFTFIMESHVSIHTYSERGFITADIYSCKEFDAGSASTYLQSIFGITTMETQILVRGKNFYDPLHSIGTGDGS